MSCLSSVLMNTHTYPQEKIITHDIKITPDDFEKLMECDDYYDSDYYDSDYSDDGYSDNDDDKFVKKIDDSVEHSPRSWTSACGSYDEDNDPILSPVYNEDEMVINLLRQNCYLISTHRGRVQIPLSDIPEFND